MIGWKKGVLWMSLAFGLGCSGIGETLLDLSGGDIELAEDGSVTVTMPDGQKMHTEMGGDLPADYPLGPPWEGATTESVVTMLSPDDETVQVIVSWPLERPREEVIAHYKGWFEQNTTNVQHKDESVAGVVTEILHGEYGDGEVLVTVTEAFGANSVSGIWAPNGLH